MVIKCFYCGKEVKLPITQAQVNDWHKKGTLIQNEFPKLSSSQREMLISKMCPECWDKVFKEEEEE